MLKSYNLRQLWGPNHHLHFKTYTKRWESWASWSLRFLLALTFHDACELSQRPSSNPGHTKIALVCSHNGNFCNLPKTGKSPAPDCSVSCLASLRVEAPSGHRLQSKATHDMTRGPHCQLWVLAAPHKPTHRPMQSQAPRGSPVLSPRTPGYFMAI